jgi:hypothetical protein
MAKTRKCAECGRVCEFDEKWQSFYHAYDFAELLAGQPICKITTFG